MCDRQKFLGYAEKKKSKNGSVLLAAIVRKQTDVPNIHPEPRNAVSPHRVSYISS